MKLTADQYYCVYFCVFEEQAMFKPLSYSSEFVSIRHPFVLSTDKLQASRQKIYEQAVQIYLCQWFYFNDVTSRKECIKLAVRCLNPHEILPWS